MFKSKKIANFLFFFTVLGSTAVFAQTLPQQQEQIEVSDTELDKFATAYQGIQVVNQEAQQKMIKTVEDEGFNVQRFNEIHQASITPDQEVDASNEELKKHKKVIGKIEGMQESFQKDMEEVIENEGLTIERYEQVAIALQTDKELQQRLQKIMQG